MGYTYTQYSTMDTLELVDIAKDNDNSAIICSVIDRLEAHSQQLESVVDTKQAKELATDIVRLLDKSDELLSVINKINSVTPKMKKGDIVDTVKNTIRNLENMHNEISTKLEYIYERIGNLDE